MQPVIRLSLASAFPILAALVPTTRAEGPKMTKITVSKETTCITEPLNPDGTPNYVAAVNALCGKGVTPDNNAAVLLLEALGPAMLKNPDTLGRVCALLRVPPPPVEGEYFVPFREYAVSHLPQEAQTDIRQRLNDRLAGPWQPKDDPLLAGWIQANTRSLDVAVSASRRKRMFVPLVSPSDPPTLYDCFMNVSLSAWMEMGRALAARAMLRLGQGQVEAASADILALHRLGALVSQGPMLIDVLIGMALDKMAGNADGALARSGKATGAQLRRHLAAVASMPEETGMIQSWDGPERLFALDMWILSARKSVREVFGPTLSIQGDPPESLPDYPLDWNEALRMDNAHTDRLVAARRLPTFRQRIEAVKAVMAEIDKIVGPDKKAYSRKMVKLVKANRRRDPAKITRATFHYLAGCCSLSPEGILTVEEQVHAFRRIAVVSLALAVWRAEKGSYPDKLDALSPAVLKALSPDPFTDKPLIYRRAGEGYVLYSVGPNMTDDGGVGSSEKKGADDFSLDARPE